MQTGVLFGIILILPFLKGGKNGFLIISSHANPSNATGRHRRPLLMVHSFTRRSGSFGPHMHVSSIETAHGLRTIQTYCKRTKSLPGIRVYLEVLKQ